MVQRFGKAATQSPEPWEATEYEGRQFIWGGPLGNLQDRSAVIATKHLMDTVEDKGFKSRCASPDQIGKHAGKKATDKCSSLICRHRKRPVMCPDYPSHFWIVRSANMKDE